MSVCVCVCVCECVCVPYTLCVSVRQFHCVGELLRHVHVHVCVCVSYSFSICYNSSGYVMDKDDDYKIKECITPKDSVTK